jgi:hypothetical protein
MILVDSVYKESEKDKQQKADSKYREGDPG